MVAKLETVTLKFACLQIHSSRYKARMSVVCLQDDELIPTRSVIVLDDTELVLNDEASDFATLASWALTGPEADVEVTTDPKRSGYCTKISFTEKPHD